jgi:uncharacterized membrane protein YdjX (TVP38/TMEM64 family)
VVLKPLVKKILLGILSLSLLYLLIDFLNAKVTPQCILDFLKPWGAFAPVVFFIFLCSTNVIPPFPVVPFWLVALAIFQKPKAILIIYAANVAGNTANYLIARYFGRPTVSKIVGKAGIAKVEELTRGITGFTEFLVVRTFGGGLTDYISYAAGFTNIKPLKYILATVLGLIPVTFIGIFMLSKALSLKNVNTIGTLILFYLVNYFMALATPALIIARKRRMK